MRGTEKILIIIPAKNEEENIQYSALSVIHSVVKANLESIVKLVIVDDGSTDDTYKKALTVSKPFNFTKVIRNPVRNPYDSSFGLARAIKLAISFAENKLHWPWTFLLQVDADTIIEEKYITKIMKAAKKHHDIGIFGGITVNEKASELHIRNTGWMLRREVWETCNKYSILPSPDTMIQLCAIANGWKIGIIKNAKMYLTRKTVHNPGKIGFTDGLTGVPLNHSIIRLANQLLHRKGLSTIPQYYLNYLRGRLYNIDIKKELSRQRRVLLQYRYKEVISKAL
ncbi:MAG: glycosyltransferase family 2 protein [Desulfurococcales archaeon]|nr:glycosyltransferase family 2 protein [Desulfurococcales archaeon]